MQISTQCAPSTAAAIASSVEPDIISVSTHTRNPRSRMLFATRSTVGCISHWYLPPHRSSPSRSHSAEKR